MPRGDEIESDESRRRRSAGSYADERDDRYGRDDEDWRYLRHKKPRERSGLVLAAGIVTIVLASGYLICGLFGGAAGACISVFAPAMRPLLAQAAAQGDPQAAQMANDMRRAESAGWLAIVGGFLNLGIGAVFLVGGICVLRRWNWARFLVIAMAIIAVIVEFFDIILKLVLGFFDHPADAVMSIGFLFVTIAYAGFVGTALLLPASSKDFAK